MKLKWVWLTLFFLYTCPYSQYFFLWESVCVSVSKSLFSYFHSASNNIFSVRIYFQNVLYYLRTQAGKKKVVEAFHSPYYSILEAWKYLLYTCWVCYIFVQYTSLCNWRRKSSWSKSGCITWAINPVKMGRKKYFGL